MLNKTDKEVFNNVFKIHDVLHVRVYANGKILSPDGSLEIPRGPDCKGYPTVNIKGRKYFVHRLVAQAWIPNPDYSKYNLVNHIDGNKQNPHVTNLEWCDHAHNNEHAIINGLRTDTVAVKAKDMATHKTLRFASITRCANYFGVHVDIIAKKLSGKSTPTFKQYVLAKEDEEFPDITLGQMRTKNSGFKKPLAYKKVDDKEWTICPDGFKQLKEIGLSETTIRRLLNKEKKVHNGYLVRELTALEYANCELVRIEAKSVRSFNNAPTPIKVTNTATGDVKEYPSTKAFAEEIGVAKHKTIQRVRNNSYDGRTYKHYKIDFIK